MSLINSTLPVHMKVLSKSGFNNYLLLLNHREISTKSLVELEIGGEYLAELYTDKGGVITFKNLYKKPNLPFFEDGLGLIVRLLEGDLDYKNLVINALIAAPNAQIFAIYKEMLFASCEGIYHIPFVFENKPCLFQLKANADSTELYLDFSVFGNMKFLAQKERVLLISPFLKVLKFLGKHLASKVPNLELLHDKSVKPLFEFKRLLDFEG